MTDKPGIVITGASGRMGQMLIKTVLESDKAELAGVVEREGHDWVGQDIGIAMGGAARLAMVSRPRRAICLGASSPTTSEK